MWRRKITLILCFLCIRSSLARSFRPINMDYAYRMEGRRQSNNGLQSVMTTTKPILQQYWQSFVRSLPTLPPISWNITNPIGNLFSGNSQQMIETPVVMHMVEEPFKRKTKATKRKKVKKNKKSITYYSTYDNNYQQMQLQPLGLDINRVMHFYEPSSRQYYALQLESQPNYYNGQYVNEYNNPYGNYYNQYNGYSGYQEDNYSLNDEDELYYQNQNPKYGYDTREIYDSDKRYDMEVASGYNQQNYAVNNDDYDKEYDQSDVDNMEYDGVELADNWGYSDDEIFADRKINGGPNNLNNFAESIIKIQKHLLKPESESDVNLLFSKDRKAHKNESIAIKNYTMEKDKETLRNVPAVLMKHSAPDKQSLKTKKVIRPTEKSQKQIEYYMFPTNFWL